MVGHADYATWYVLYGLTAATIIMNILMRDSLYFMGEEFIETLQSNSNVFFDWFFILITMIIDPTIIIILTITVLLLSRSKQKAINVFIFIILNTFLAATFKAYYKDPRPIWTSPNIRNIGFYCPIQYGNPSGHSWFSVVLGFGLLFEYQGYGKNWRNFYISLGLMVLVPFSRMYLGAHSLNQVLEGIAYGLVMCVFYPVTLKSMIAFFLDNFHKQHTLKLAVLISHLLYLIPFLMGLGLELPKQWEDNITLKCNKFINQSQLNFLMFTFNGVLINLITGLAIGYLKLKENHEGAVYLQGNWQFNEQRYELKKAKFYHAMIQLSLLASGLVAGLIICSYFKGVKILVFIVMNTGALVSGWLYCTYSAHFLFKWRILEQKPAIY